MKTITAYKTIDDRLFEDEVEALKHENRILADAKSKLDHIEFEQREPENAMNRTTAEGMNECS